METQQLRACAPSHTPALRQRIPRMHASQPFTSAQRPPVSLPLHTAASSLLRLRRRGATIRCKAATDGQTGADGEKDAVAIELAEEGPSTDVAVIWSRLAKVRSSMMLGRRD